jgi:TPR repeat protein
MHATGIVLVCSLFLLSACSTTPIEKSSEEKASILETQGKRFQLGKELYLSQQYGQAANILLPLAQQGHLDSQYTVGYMYHHGQGVPRNEKESTRWIAMAAARGHAKAKEALNRINALHDQLNPPQ